MRTLQEKYNGVLEGKFSKTQFRRDAAIEMPQFVSTVNSFDDTVSILKNRGTITEAKKQEPKYSTAKPADHIAPDVLDTGIKFELDKKYGTLDVTPEQYAKCREMAIKNLSKDVLYYVKQDSIQLDEPGEKMEKAKLNEGLFDRFKKKPAQSSTAPAEVLSADEIQDRIDKAETGTIVDILDAAVVQQTIDLRNATPEQIKTFVSVAREADAGGDTVTGDNYMNYLKELPNYNSIEEAGMLEGMSKEEAWKKFQEDNHVTSKTVVVAKKDFEKEWAKRTDEVKVKVSIPGQDEFEAEEGKDYSEAEAKEYIANAKKHGATPMGTKFTKTDEAIQNIENDEQTKRRIAGLTNQLLKDVDPRDEDHAVKAYAISVKNDLESDDASRLKRYKDFLSIDDLKDDMRHYISHDVDQLEESQYSISDIQNKFQGKAFDIQQAALRAVGATDVQAAYSKSAGDFEKALYKAAHGNLEEEVNEGEWEDKGQSKELNKKRLEDLKAKRAKGGPKGALAVMDKEIAQLEKLVNEGDIKLSAEDMEKLHKDGKITLPDGSILHFAGKADEEVDGPDVEDLYQNDDEYLATLKQRKALKEMFKKIITKIITEEAGDTSDLMNIAQALHRGFSEKGATAAAVGADGKTLTGNVGAAQVVITLKDDHIILKAKTSSAGDSSQATARQVEDALEGIRTSANNFQVKTTKSLPGEFTAVVISK